jgi:hypothetical protein
LFNLLDGLLNSFVPQYIVKGNDIIPTQVIMVPKGIVSSVFKAFVSTEEPVNKSIRTPIVNIKAL